MSAQLGIDIGTANIKLVAVGGGKVSGAQVISNPLGKVKMETENEIVKMAEEIKKGLFSEVKLANQKAAIVIPESVVNSRVISMPVLTEAELSNAIKWEAEQYIPKPLEEVELSWQVVDRPEDPKGKMKVYLVAVDKALVGSLINMFSRLGLEPVSIQPELVAASQVLEDGGDVMLTTMGASSVSAGVFSNGKMLFVYEFGSGGTALTRAIASGLQLNNAQAEEYKRSYGVRKDVLEGRLYQAMKPVVDGVVTEMKKVINYYNQSFAKESQLSRVVLSGGMALTPGIVELLSSELSAQVELNSSYGKLQMAAGIEGNLGVIYTPAVGVVQS